MNWIVRQVMRPTWTRVLTVGMLLPTIVAADTPVAWEEQWPQWRGPRADGIATHADPPLHWDPSTNIRWKVAIAGESSATPIVWGERVIVISAEPTDRVAETPTAADPEARTEPPNRFYRFVVHCLSRSSGETLWQRVAREAVPHEGHHKTNTYASGSPCTDGERIYVSFGSQGIYCYDFDGNLLWNRDLGDLRTRRGWGEAITPAVFAGTLIVNWDQEQDSFITALDATTGQERWRVPRDEPTTWNTPLVVTVGQTTQVVVNGQNRVRSYDLQTGDLIWQCGGQTVNPIPSPVASNGLVYCFSGYQGAAGFAIPLDARGDLSETDRVRWSVHSGTPYVPSPLVYQGQVYFTRANSGILTSVDANDGRVIFGPERIAGIDNLYSSPVAAQGRIYVVSREGTTAVLEAGTELKILATNTLDEPIDASPVLVGKQLFLRGAQHLYCIE